MNKHLIALTVFSMITGAAQATIGGPGDSDYHGITPDIISALGSEAVTSHDIILTLGSPNITTVWTDLVPLNPNGHLTGSDSFSLAKVTFSSDVGKTNVCFTPGRPPSVRTHNGSFDKTFTLGQPDASAYSISVTDGMTTRQFTPSAFLCFGASSPGELGSATFKIEHVTLGENFSIGTMTLTLPYTIFVG